MWNWDADAIIIRDRRLKDTTLTKPPVPYDFCFGVPISHLLTVVSTPVKHSVLIVSCMYVCIISHTKNILTIEFTFYNIVDSCITMKVHGLVCFHLKNIFHNLYISNCSVNFYTYKWNLSIDLCQLHPRISNTLLVS